MMKKYIPVVLTVEEFFEEDVIRTSGITLSEDLFGGNGDIPSFSA